MKTGRVTKIVLASAFLLIAVLSTATAQSLRENSGFRAELTDLTPNTSIKKYGNLITTYGIASKKTNEDNSWYWVANEGIELPVEFLFTMSGKVRFRPLSPDSSQSRDSWMKYALMLFSVIRTDS